MNFRANGTAVSFQEEMHYYPFGMQMEGISATPVTNNAYKYNGKEWNDDFGLGLSDYGARWYDAAVGRWWGVDAKPKVYESPYLSFANSPIIVTDPNGLDSLVIHLQQVKGSKDAKKANIVLFEVTFYVIKNGVWTKIETKPSKITGRKGINLVMPGKSYRGLNKIDKKDFYDIKYQKMASHENFENTIMIQPGTGKFRGQFIHEGKNVDDSAGCLLACQEDELSYTHHEGTDMSDPYSDVVLYKKGNGKASGNLSRELLQGMREIYDEADSNNSMKDKPLGFLLTTKSVTQYLNEKATPEIKNINKSQGNED